MSENKRLLVCIPEIPYPVRRNGVSIRYLPILEHFNKIYEIDLLLILKEPADKSHIKDLEKYCTNLHVLVQKKRKPNILKKILVNLSAFVPAQQPLEIYNYNNEQIKSFIVSKTAGIHYDVKLSVTVAYVELIQNYVTADRHIVDSIDSIYAHLLRSYKDGLLNKYKLSLVRRWELRIIAKADMVSYVSPMDVDILTKGKGGLENVVVVPNGIYIDDYTKEVSPIEGFVIGFLGNMDYYPNIQAALKLSGIFNNLKNELTDIKLLIIGRNPGQEILDLKDNPGVIVTGTVDSIWPYVNATDVFVFPMIYGSGQQNKLLDVMYAGCPVISSALGNSGIGAKDGVEVEIADSDDEIIAKIKKLYSDEGKLQGLAQNGRSYIVDKYGWNAIFKLIDSKYFIND